MTEPKLNTPENVPSSSSSSSYPSPSAKVPSEINKGHTNNTNKSFSGQKAHFPNPPDASNPDPATLREQWKFAIRQYSKWYSHAWGTAILAGVSIFALGWVIKGSNPLPSFGRHDDSPPPPDKADEAPR